MKNKKKILILSHRFFPDIGGIESVSEMLAYEFTRAGYDVFVVTKSIALQSDDFPFKVIRNPDLIKIVTLFKNTDVILENNPCLRMSWSNFFLRRPIVVSLQTWLQRVDGRIGLEQKVKFWWLKRAKYVVACSNAIKDRNFKRSIVIHNSYDNTLFRILPEITKTKDFVFVGRLVSDKGIDISIRAFKLFLKEHPNSHFTIIGTGELSTELNRLVESIGLSGNVTFVGSLKGESLVECLNEHRYLLVPSVWEEPFGIVTLEGMACGCVPIVSDGGGLPEAIGNAGLLFKRGDVNDLFRCMKLIKEFPKIELDLKYNAIIHLKKHYIKNVALKYLEILEKALL